MRHSLLAIIVLIVVICAVVPRWPYSTGWGWYPTGGLGTVLVILLVLILLGVI